jgi:hypothetical protein
LEHHEKFEGKKNGKKSQKLPYLDNNFMEVAIKKMLELNGKPSSVTTFSTDFSFQNLVFWNLLEIFSGRNHLKNQYLPPIL